VKAKTRKHGNHWTALTFAFNYNHWTFFLYNYGKNMQKLSWRTGWLSGSNHLSEIALPLGRFQCVIEIGLYILFAASLLATKPRFWLNETRFVEPKARFPRCLTHLGFEAMAVENRPVFLTIVRKTGLFIRES